VDAGLPGSYVANEKTPGLFGLFSRPKEFFSGAEASSLFVNYRENLQRDMAQYQGHINRINSGDTPLNRDIGAVAGVLNRLYARSAEYIKCIESVLALENQSHQLQDPTYLEKLKLAMETRVEKGADRQSRKVFALATGTLAALALAGGVAYLSRTIDNKIGRLEKSISVSQPAASPAAKPNSLASSSASLEAVASEYTQ